MAHASGGTPLRGSQNPALLRAACPGPAPPQPARLPGIHATKFSVPPSGGEAAAQSPDSDLQSPSTNEPFSARLFRHGDRSTYHCHQLLPNSHQSDTQINYACELQRVRRFSSPIVGRRSAERQCTDDRAACRGSRLAGTGWMVGEQSGLQGAAEVVVAVRSDRRGSRI